MLTYPFQPAVIARSLILFILSVTISLYTQAQTFPDGIDIIQSENGMTHSFDQAIHLTTDLLPNSVSIADLDGDGKPDLATPNNYITNNASSISLLRNTSINNSVTFAAKYDLPHAAITAALGIADFNGDGKPDIVATSVADANISIFKNASTPGVFNFSKVVSYTAGSNSYSIAIADFDKDNKPDIAVGNYLSNSVSLYRNTSSGNNISFAAKIDIATELAPRYIVTGDLDGDGLPEIVAVNELSNSISIFKNNSSSGNISFAARTNYPTGDKPSSVALGDIDGDGKKDIVISNENENKLTAYKNNTSGGAITLSAPINIQSPAGSVHVTIGDLNGDGKPEIVSKGLNIEIFQNSSTPGAFTFKPTVYISVNNTTRYVAIGDLTNDGKPELIAAVPVLNKLTVFRNRNNEPAVISFSPNTGVAGEEIEIKGLNFKNISQVTIAGNSAQSYTVVDEFTIKAIVPATISGDIIIKNNHGSGTGSGFIYAAPPTITSFNPTAVAQAGEVHIIGTNFSSVTEVSFGGVVISNFEITSPTTITAYVNPGTSGAVRVKNPYGSVSVNGFILLPTISFFSPSAAASGNVVTIEGANFSSVDAVTFGNEPAQSFEIISSSVIKATVGNGKSGDIKLFISGNAVAKAGFTYIAPPTISKVSPLRAATNTTVTIEGTNFNNVSTVTFGGTNVTFTLNSSTSISALVKTGSSGNIKITTPGGTANFSGFVFVPKPTVTNFYPKKAGKGAVVTIIGTLFDEMTAVRFGTAAAESFIVHSADSITAIVGNGATGLLEVVGFGGTANGQQFTYTTTPIIYKVIPSSGPVGSIINISGSNLSAGAAVYFGAVKAEVISGTGNTLQVRVPQGAAYGNITVVNNGRSCYSPLPFTPTFGNGSETLSFTGKTDLTAAGNTRYVAIGDFDGDGKPDIASANGSAKSISIYRNRSTVNNLAFAPKIDLSSQSEPYMIASADIDGDGKPDIISLNFNGSYHGIVYRNTSVTSNISFAEGKSFTTHFSPSDLVIADLDGDGKLDIAMPNANTSVDGSSFFTVLTNKSTAGNIDFIEHPERVLKNKGYGITWPAKLVAADLNIDGNIDLSLSYTGSFYESIVSILKNVGASTQNYDELEAQVPGSVGAVSRGITSADFDLDGLPDLLCTDGVLRNKGNFTFDFVALANPVTNIVRNIPVADFNGDGKPDFVKIIANDIGVHINTTAASTISFANAINFNTAIAHTAAAAVDLDGDGKPEIITANGNETISILKNTTGPIQTVTVPEIVEIYPAYGSTGTQVTIVGTRFTHVSAVTFGGVAANSFTVHSQDTITAIIGAGASGVVAVTNNDGVGSLPGFNFVDVPTITAELSTEFCEGDSARLISSSAIHNQWYKNGEIITNATGPILKVFEAGNYAVAFKAGEFISPLSNVIEITVKGLPDAPQITLEDERLKSSYSLHNQWYVDSTSYINGATDQYFRPDSSGYYSVSVSADGCNSKLSALFKYTYTKPADTTLVNDPPQFVRLSPNPVTSSMTKVKFNEELSSHVDIEVADARGQIIMVLSSVSNDDYINLLPLRKGVYYLRFTSKNGKIKTTSTIIRM